MKHKHSKMKLPLILVAPTTIIAPLLISSSQVTSNNKTLKTDLSAAQYVKVVYKSNVPDAIFDGQVVAKAKKGAIFGSLTKPTVSATGCRFLGWYKDSEYKTEFSDTDQINDASTTVWAKFEIIRTDYTFELQTDSNATELYVVQNPQAFYSGGTDTLTLKKKDASVTKTLSPTDSDAWSKITSLTIGPEVLFIGDDFLKGFTYFNASIAFSVDTKITSIGNNFASGLANFNQSITFPDTITTLKTIGTGFLKDNPKFGDGKGTASEPHSFTIKLPNSLESVGSNFMANCPNFHGTIDAGTLEDKVFTGDNSSLSTSEATSPSYVTGIQIKGTYKEQILSKWVPVFAGGAYRKTIGASFVDCTWRYLSTVARQYESSSQDDTAKTLFCSYFLKDSTNFFTSLDEFIGLEKTVKINGQDHKVKVVDHDHDTLASGEVSAGKKATFTFEFANLISDSSGKSIATVWHDNPAPNYNNKDYLNSIIRWQLTHEGTGGTYNYWFKYNATTHSTDSDVWDTAKSQSRSVLEMIEIGTNDLYVELRRVDKIAAYCASGGVWSSWEAQPYTSKLFLPTRKEICATDSQYDIVVRQGDYGGTTYKYYVDHTGQSFRFKKQVNNDQSTNQPRIDASESSSGTQAYNYAGYNNLAGAGIYWLSNPSNASDTVVMHIHWNGQLAGTNNVNLAAAGIAPLFCI